MGNVRMIALRAPLVMLVSLAFAAGETAAGAGGDAAGISGVHPLAYYLELGQHRNPAILAARREAAAVEATIPQVTSLNDPVLTETFRPFTNHSLQTASGRAPNALMISQKLPWPEKLDVRGEVAEQEARVALAQLAGQRLAVTEAIRRAYYDLYYFQRALAITEQSRKLLEKLKQLATIRLESGGSLQDVVLVKIERQRLREKRIGYEKRLQQAQARIAALIDAPPGATPRAVDSLDLPHVPHDLDRLYALASRNRPQLHAAVHTIRQRQRKRRLAHLEYYPDLQVGVSWGAITTKGAVMPIATGNDIIGFTVGVDLPVYRNRIRAGVREAENRVASAARRYEAATNSTFREIRRLVLEAEAAAKKRDLYRDRLLPNAEDAIALSIADYEASETDILQVITNYTELLEFQTQAERFTADLGQALASLSRVVGCPLTAFGGKPSGAKPPPAPAPGGPPSELKRREDDEQEQKKAKGQVKPAVHELPIGENAQTDSHVPFHPEIISLGPK